MHVCVCARTGVTACIAASNLQTLTGGMLAWGYSLHTNKNTPPTSIAWRCVWMYACVCIRGRGVWRCMCVCREMHPYWKNRETQAENNRAYVCVVENECQLIMEVSSTVSVVQFYQWQKKTPRPCLGGKDVFHITPDRLWKDFSWSTKTQSTFLKTISKNLRTFWKTRS